MAEALIHSAIKRALEQSMSTTSQTHSETSMASTPKSKSTNMKEKRQKMDLSLDESIISSAKEFVDDALDNAAVNLGNCDLGAKDKKIAEAVLKLIRSDLITAVNKALELFFKEVMEQLNEKVDRIAATVQRSGLLARYESDSDKLEQYSRRESIRVSGLDIPDGADTAVLMEQVCKLASDIGVDLSKNDIVACHSVGGGKHKQLLCRFTTRIKKEEVMRAKKKLKDVAGGKVYVNEDLTPLRVKLLQLVKEKTGYKHAHTINGRIVVFKEKKRSYIENPDDLFKVGINVDQETLVKLGLSNYLMPL